MAVLLVDEQGRIAEVNPAAENLLGRSSSRLVGQALPDALALDDARVSGSLLETDRQFAAYGISLGPVRHGSTMSLTSSPMSDHAGWRVITLSETGPSRVDEEADRYELRAPAVLAHEIKNPLSAIRGAGQLLARRADGRDAQLTTLILNEVDRIAQLIDRMQELSAGSIHASEACNVHEAIRNAVSTVRAGRPDCPDPAEAFDPSLPPIEGSRGALELVMINLLANACDACAGSEDARIAIRTRFAGGPVINAVRDGMATRLPIEITVTDSGPGVDSALRDHLFEPFVTTKPHGQGLGLALVRKLLRDMDGRITHERDERAGLTHFRINLPTARRG